MKKVVLALACFFVLFDTWAQVSILPKAGATLGYYRADKTSREIQGSRLGVVGGVGFNFGITKPLSLQSELIFIQKGSKLNFGKLGNQKQDNKIISVVNSIELPVLLRYTFGKGKFQPYLNLGTSVGFKLGGYQKSNFNYLALTTSYQYYYPSGNTTDDDLYFKVRYGDPSKSDANTLYITGQRIDLAIQSGGGFLYKVGTGHLNFDTRFGFSFLEIGQNIWAFTLGYQIPLNSKK